MHMPPNQAAVGMYLKKVVNNFWDLVGLCGISWGFVGFNRVFIGLCWRLWDFVGLFGGFCGIFGGFCGIKWDFVEGFWGILVFFGVMWDSVLGCKPTDPFHCRFL